MENLFTRFTKPLIKMNYSTIQDIQDKIESIMAAIQEDYQFDNIQIILERSRTMINLQADIPSLLHAAMTLKSDCELAHIDDKLSTRKILCAAENNILIEVKSIEKSLSQASKTLQSQLATLRAELTANMYSKG